MGVYDFLAGIGSDPNAIQAMGNFGQMLSPNSIGGMAGGATAEYSKQVADQLAVKQLLQSLGGGTPKTPTGTSPSTNLQDNFGAGGELNPTGQPLQPWDPYQDIRLTPDGQVGPTAHTVTRTPDGQVTQIIKGNLTKKADPYAPVPSLESQPKSGVSPDFYQTLFS